MSLIDRLREMPELRRAATKPPWTQILTGMCGGAVFQVSPQFTDKGGMREADATYIAACGKFSEDDWAALIELREAAAWLSECQAVMNWKLKTMPRARIEENTLIVEDDNNFMAVLWLEAHIETARQELDAVLAKLEIT